MPRYVAQRLSIWGLTLLGASVLIFLMMSSLGGDAASVLLGDQATPEAIAALRQQMGLDRPVWIRYGEWLTGLATGDSGVSAVTQQDIAQAIWQRMSVTVPLAVGSLILSLLIGIPLGLYAALHRSSKRGLAASMASQFGMAMPAFFGALILSTIVGLYLGWLPTGGYVSWSADPIGFTRSMILPTLTLGLITGAYFARYFRSAVVDVSSMDFMRTARAKGLSERQALYRHGLRNAALPLITIVGVEFAVLLGGSVVIENVYSLPGVGQLIVDSIFNRDVEMIQSAVLVLTALTLAVNFTVDMLYGVIDPRTRPPHQP
jgi:peptide/nickel transport system permease protein